MTKISIDQLFTILVILLNHVCLTGAFLVTIQEPNKSKLSVGRLTTTTPTRTSTALHASGDGRRQILSRLKRIFVSAGAVSSSTNINKIDRTASAAQEDATRTTNGRVVKMIVKNIGGEAGTKGTIKIQLRPEWAPRGVKRFEELTEQSFWDGCRVFRVLPGFIAQFGINGNVSVQKQWRSANIPDDPVKKEVTNKRGTVVFATAGPNTRTTQIFINTKIEGNHFLDKQGFAPIGEIIEGMDIVDQFYSGYSGNSGDVGRGGIQTAAAGGALNPGLIQSKGNAYLTKYFPKLTYISKASFTK